jgi:hypothetical protein
VYGGVGDLMVGEPGLEKKLSANAVLRLGGVVAGGVPGNSGHLPSERETQPPDHRLVFEPIGHESRSPTKTCPAMNSLYH